MEFKRRKKRGQRGKVRRTWISSDQYRIIWFKESFGVTVPPRFQATVRVVIPGPGQRNDITGENTEQGSLTWELWDFVNHRRPLIKTMKAAQGECSKHKALWLKACEAGGARELKELFGKIPNGMPVWTTKKANRKVYGLCMDSQPIKYQENEECNDQNDQSETSRSSLTSVTGSEKPNIGPVSSAVDTDTSTVPTPVPTPVSIPPAPTAEAPAEDRKPQSKKRTTKCTKRIAKRKTSTSDASGSAKKRYKSSVKKKSRPSKN